MARRIIPFLPAIIGRDLEQMLLSGESDILIARVRTPVRPNPRL